MKRYAPARTAMPTIRRTRGSMKLRRKRRRRFGRQLTYRQRAATPFKIVRVLKSVKYWALNPGAAGAIDARVTAPNSAYDWSQTEGTEQPLGFDEAATLYNRYCVIGFRIHFEATSADATNPVIVGCNVQTSASTLTSYAHYKELPNTVSRIMTPDVDKVLFSISGSTGKFHGTRIKLSDDRFVADVTASPANLVYAHIFAQPVDGATDVGVIHLVATIYQTVVFFKPKTPARS